MAKRPESLNQLMMLGITPEAPRPARLDDVATFDGQDIRMVHVDGETWWALADIARILGYADAKDAGRLLRDKHKGRSLVPTLGGPQEMLTVNEPGLYRLMMRSDKPEAERFQDWVTDEVLPAIRKYGFYSAAPPVARTMRRLACDAPTALVRLDLRRGYKTFCGVQARHGAKPYHYMRNCDSIYRALYAGRGTKELRKGIGIARRATPMDHMSRFALDVHLFVLALAERCLEERLAAGDPVPLADQPAFIAAKVEEAASALLAVVGPGSRLDPVDDPRRGLIYDVIQRQLEGPN